MDLWIKCQDGKRIGKIDYIEYAEDDNGYCLIGWRNKFEGTKIATYKTKERCLEVLEEIWKKISITQYVQINSVEAKLMLIKYEMPKE
jgi:hypothetical protein